MRLPRPKGRLAQAVLPVLAGIAVIAVIGLALWAVAAVASGHADQVRLGAPTFQVGRSDRLADLIAKDGPLLFPGLVGPAGKRPVGLDHRSANDAEGWHVFSLVPAGAAPDCLVAQDRASKRLVDCHGQAVDAADLPDAPGVSVTVTAKGQVVLDLTP